MTVVYVSSNREDPIFEAKIIADLKEKTKHLEVISVTQKPVDLGKNICVGDVGASGYNFCRQILIGCEEAKGDFIISAESDCVYSPDYFYFTPERKDICCRNQNIAVLKYKKGFFRKDSSTFSQVIGREFYIKRLRDLFSTYPDHPVWDASLKSWPKAWGRKFMDEFEYFKTKFPCVSFKTGRGMRLNTNSDSLELDSLPYWGTVDDFRAKFL
jgi:hypothetical protein